jgi:hypothetical protein
VYFAGDAAETKTHDLRKGNETTMKGEKRQRKRTTVVNGTLKSAETEI